VAVGDEAGRDGAVRIRGFSFGYSPEGERRLRGVDLEVGAGEFLVVVGPSGGGKSTLISAINGIVPHEFDGAVVSGSVEADGMAVRSHQPHEIATRVGTVLQDPDWQLVRPVVEDEIVFGMENLGRPPEEMARRLEDVLGRLELGPVRDRSVDTLSGGQKQRVAIAAALAMGPGVLLLDEPTAELDPAGKELVLEAARRLNRNLGVTVVLVDHNLDLTVPAADRVAFVAEGRLVAAEEPARLFAPGGPLEGTGFEAPQPTVVCRRLFPDMPGASLPATAEDAARLILSRFATGGRKKPPRWEPTLTAAGREAPGGDDVAPRGDPVVRLEDVSFRYRSDAPFALRGLSLEISAGEAVAVVGPNGSGKSTMCRAMLGLVRPERGRVEVGGRDARGLDPGELGQQVGYVFQNPDHQMFEQTVFDEVAFGLRLRGHDEGSVEEKVLKTLALLGVGDQASEHPHFLSRGQRRRVAMASVIVLEPRVLVLDEPTTGLDPPTARKMALTLGRLRARGHAVVVLTHDLRFVAEHLERVVVLDGGAVTADGPAREILPRLAAATGGAVKPPPVTVMAGMLGDLGVPPGVLTTEELVAAVDDSIRGPAGPLPNGGPTGDRP
jgi:energy-coupling factor transport system ATP-binding protein